MKATKMNTQNDFSKRLYEEFQKMGLPMHSPTQITRIINRRALHARVTPQAVRKWLYHGVFPSQDKLINLAKWLGISVQWLRYGIGNREINSTFILNESLYEDYNAPHISDLVAEIVQLPERHIDHLRHVIQTLRQNATAIEHPARIKVIK